MWWKNLPKEIKIIILAIILALVAVWYFRNDSEKTKKSERIEDRFEQQKLENQKLRDLAAYNDSIRDAWQEEKVKLQEELEVLQDGSKTKYEDTKNKIITNDNLPDSAVINNIESRFNYED